MGPRTFVALDLETTGLNPKRDAIIEFGAVRVQGGTVQERFTSYINPGRPIPLRIQQITGIQPADVADAPPIEKIRPEILAFLRGNTEAIIAHNAAFDISFLNAAGVRVHVPVLDTYELATILLPDQDSYSLGELCRDLAIPLPLAHRAGHDAEATAALLMHLLAKVEALPPTTLEVLCAAAAESNWGPMLLFRDALEKSRTSSQWPVTNTTPAAKEAWPVIRKRTVQATDDQALATAVISAFGEDGPLAAEFGEGASIEFEHRAGQLEMAQQVLDTLNRGDHTIIEAGTGTGKSLAYLLPAAAWAMVHDSRVVIATNTIPLQDQLLEQELPRVAQALAISLPAAASVSQHSIRAMALKGRAHYLCTRRLAHWLGDRTLAPLELRFLAKILLWLPHTQSGDLSELVIHDRREQELTAYVSSLADECNPQHCSARLAPGQRNRIGLEQFRDFYLENYGRAESAHLLVVNHALLLADVEANGRVLPAYEHLIVDEAHHLEAAATEQFTRQMDSRKLLALVAATAADQALVPFLTDPRWGRLMRQLAADRRALQASIPEFFNMLQNFVLSHKDVRPRPGYPQRVALDSGLRTQPEWSEIEIEWDRISQQLATLLGRLEELAAQLDAAQWWQEEDGPRGLFLRTLHRTHGELAGMLQATDEVILRLQPLDQDVSVAWLELNAKADAVVLCNAAVQVSEKLAANLFHHLRAVVLTGATLGTGDGFDFLRDRLGCWEASGMVIDSPFDYKRNVLLYMPSDMPMPDQHNYQQALEQAIVQAALAADGRTLVLFTNHSQLRITAEAVRAPLAAAGLPILQQGEGSRRRNLRDFRANPRAVLLGTGTYWEGIDLPGEQLVCLLIARLPFAVPSDPLFAARSRLYEDAFHEYALPDAVIRLRQGFGRLIRSATDRGVVVLLDSRLWQRRYGEVFLDALPACTTRHSPLWNLEESVDDWLRNAKGERLVASSYLPAQEFGDDW